MIDFCVIMLYAGNVMLIARSGDAMLDIKQDITSLSNFQRNTRDFLARLRETGRPLVLTVNGNAALVVQDAAAYQQILDGLDEIDERPTAAKVG
jgi:PHD/YefM family antitoxin component YafN of YafNO toxin-antitoxin module